MQTAYRLPRLNALLFWGVMGVCAQAILTFNGGQVASAQNLISNWSIEPPEGQPAPCAYLSVNSELNSFAPGYSMPTLGTPDVFSAEAEQGCFASLNVGNPMHPGAIRPRSGKQVAGIIAHTSSPSQEAYREYLGVEFSESLIIGETYYLEFFFQLSQRSEYLLPQLGAALVDSMTQELTTGTLALTPILNFNGAVAPGNWVKASATFVASSASKGLVLGRFANSGDAQASGNQNGVRPVAYYYFDDITVQKASEVAFRGDLAACEGSLANVEVVSNYSCQWLGWTTTGWEVLQSARFVTINPTAYSQYAVVMGADTTIVPLSVSPALPARIEAYHSLCDGKATLVAPLAQNYLWTTGDTTRSIEVYVATSYWVKIQSGACWRMDTLMVGQPETLPTDFLPEVGQLQNGSVTLAAPQRNFTYLWSNGATSRILTATKTGLYACQVSNGCSTMTDSTNVVAELPTQASLILTPNSGPLQLPTTGF